MAVQLTRSKDLEGLTVPDPSNRYLVYTSAGNANAISLWLGRKRNFDLWVCYYTTGSNHDERINYRSDRKGGKFQNLRTDWIKNADIFNRYDAVLVMDDDVIINTAGINRLFEIQSEYGLTLLQPAFIEPGKISHPVTRRNPKYTLRYTSFVELTCPLFERSALEEFLSVYDGSLSGWGIDHWFVHVLNQRDDFSAAVVDAVTCFNPWDNTKGGRSEIQSLQTFEERVADWERVKATHRINEADSETITVGVRRNIFQRLLLIPLDYLLKRIQLRRYKLRMAHKNKHNVV